MGWWARVELAAAFEHYGAAVVRCASTGDWEPFVQCFIPDATYVEHVYGNFTGHGEIRAWVNQTMGSFPGNEMVAFPARWVSIDEELGQVVCEVRNVMRDPGDASVHEASNLTILRYAGDNRWREEEDVYNPAHFRRMTQRYLQRCQELGTTSEDARLWAKQMGIALPEGHAALS